jgi:hypothetical protein
MTPGKFIPFAYDGIGHRKEENFFGNVKYGKSGFIEILTGGGLKGFLKFIKNRGIIRYQAQSALIECGGCKFAVGIVSQYRTLFKNKYFQFSEITKFIEHNLAR